MSTTRSITIFVLLLLFAAAIAAQDPPPPPPAKMTVTGVPVDINKFTSERGGFQAGFPISPQRAEVPIDSSFGKTNMVTYSLQTALAGYYVIYLDFPTEMSDKYDLNVRFDAMRDAQLEQMSGKVSSDVEMSFGDRFGRETVIESKTSSVSMRAIVAGPRLYVLMVETPGELSSQSERLRSANATRIKRFFDSFVIIKEIRPTEERAELPVDFGINFENGVFTSTFFGVSLTAPSGWKAVENENAAELFEIGKEMLATSDPKRASYISDENARLLAMISKNDLATEVPTAVMSILAERAAYPSFKARSVAETFLQLYLDPTEIVVKEVATMSVGGDEFAWFETFDTAGEVYTRMLFTNRKGIVFEIVLSYSDTEDLAAMLRSLNTLKFDEK